MWYLWLIAGLLVIVAIAIHPIFLSWLHDFFGTWEDECDRCGAIRKCYPVKQRGIQTGMISTMIGTSCQNCGESTDPNYVSHMPERSLSGHQRVAHHHEILSPSASPPALGK